jgi:hypothetical protein
MKTITLLNYYNAFYHLLLTKLNINFIYIFHISMLPEDSYKK